MYSHVYYNKYGFSFFVNLSQFIKLNLDAYILN